MLEEAAIPALWSAVNGFFTPAVLFILLNVVIGTIAVTSKSSAPPAAAANGGESASAVVEGGVEHQPQQRRLSRVPSMAFERLRSFNLSRFAAPAPEPASVDRVVDLGYEQPPAPTAPEKEAAVKAAVDPEPEREAEHAHAHMERCRSEAAADLEVPRLPARLHKSASEMSAFAHFEAEEVEEAVQAVEKRRPATTRDGAAGRRLSVEGRGFGFGVGFRGGGGGAGRRRRGGRAGRELHQQVPQPAEAAAHGVHPALPRGHPPRPGSGGSRGRLARIRANRGGWMQDTEKSKAEAETNNKKRKANSGRMGMVKIPFFLVPFRFWFPVE
ncbi:hypothetical protein PR202_ga15127 [Eleusine coracana subsp. coracana]|uniref:DUF4408 domain-containing protein n=1 Tax=Eleusine coracana subsp. coracana TaxID=191504 RepID=A0AAV5CIX0_ELECO|nr:hypothetical protein PR202_ga15127 [Eleusine coracana subsp. coracana]